MNSLKNSMRLVKILAFALSFLMFCFPTAAMAESPKGLDNLVEDIIPETIGIIDGKFSVGPISGGVPFKTTITRAVITILPPGGETGTIDKILITGPDGKPEFTCPQAPFEAEQGSDLIQLCGGKPVDLQPGVTTYEASGSDFGPQFNTLLGIQLETE